MGLVATSPRQIVRSMKRLALTLTLTAGLFWVYLWATRTDPIESLLTKLAADFSFDEPLHPIALMSFARANAELADDPLRIQVQYQGENYVREVSRSMLVNHAASVRRGLSQLAVSLRRLDIEYQGASDATATLEVRVMGKKQSEDGYFLEIFDVEASLTDGPEGWRLREVRAIDLRHEEP